MDKTEFFNVKHIIEGKKTPEEIFPSYWNVRNNVNLIHSQGKLSLRKRTNPGKIPKWITKEIPAPDQAKNQHHGSPIPPGKKKNTSLNQKHRDEWLMITLSDEQARVEQVKVSEKPEKGEQGGETHPRTLKPALSQSAPVKENNWNEGRRWPAKERFIQRQQYQIKIIECLIDIESKWDGYSDIGAISERKKRLNQMISGREPIPGLNFLMQQKQWDERQKAERLAGEMALLMNLPAEESRNKQETIKRAAQKQK